MKKELSEEQKEAMKELLSSFDETSLLRAAVKVLTTELDVCAVFVGLFEDAPKGGKPSIGVAWLAGELTKAREELSSERAKCPMGNPECTRDRV